MMETLDSNSSEAQADDELTTYENRFSGRNLLDLNEYINSEKVLHNSDSEILYTF